MLSTTTRFIYHSSTTFNTLHKSPDLSIGSCATQKVYIQKQKTNNRYTDTQPERYIENRRRERKKKKLYSLHRRDLLMVGTFIVNL